MTGVCRCYTISVLAGGTALARSIDVVAWTDGQRQGEFGMQVVIPFWGGIAIAGLLVAAGWGRCAGIPRRRMLWWISLTLTVALLAPAHPWYLVGSAALALAAHRHIMPPRPRRITSGAQRVLRLTPGFIGYVRIALAGGEAPLHILAHYVEHAHSGLAPMRELVAAALSEARSSRRRGFAVLAELARVRGHQPLAEAAAILADAEERGIDADAALERYQHMLDGVLHDAFMQQVRRRSLMLLGVSALSLVLGVVGNILFVMTDGGRALGII